MIMNAIELKEVCFSYHHQEVLRGINLVVKKGEFCGIIGPNGAGKSTLLRIIARILQEDKGTVLIKGKEAKFLRRKDLAQILGFIPQETYFQLNYSVEDIIAMGRYPYLEPFQRMSQKDIAAIEWAIQQTHSEALRHRYINALSAGERQMIVIARALAQEPEILLLDEPTSHLDIYHQSAIMELLKNLNNQGITVVSVNHDLNITSQYCKRLVLMHRGGIHRTGSPEEIINRQTIREVYGIETDIVLHPEKNVPQVLLK